MNDRDLRFDDTSFQPQSTTIAQPLPATTPVVPTQEPLPQEKTVNRVKNKLGRMHLFSAFCENPAHVYFQTQEEDEKILLFLRKSQILNIPWLVTTILLVLVPLLVYIMKDFFGTFIPPLQYLFILVPFYYLLVATYAFVNFITWYYNAALVTDKRVIDIDFHQLVFKDVAETKLTLVQDVSYKEIGALENLFGFGYVLIQTAGTLDNFEFWGLPQPSRVAEIVDSLIGRRPVL